MFPEIFVAKRYVGCEVCVIGISGVYFSVVRNPFQGLWRKNLLE